MYMQQRAYGFTIVELLITIVVIGILAGISTVAFGGVQNRAHNSARYHELKAWEKQFELYKAFEGGYPAMATGGYCLGSGFPIGAGGVRACRDYTAGTATTYYESNNTALMTELKKVGTLPGGPRKPVTFTVGPYVNYDGSGNIYLRTILNGQTCPSGTVSDYVDTANNYVLCRIHLTI